jgi:DNA polymerase III epsilon subunit-like protein
MSPARLLSRWPPASRSCPRCGRRRPLPTRVPAAGLRPCHTCRAAAALDQRSAINWAAARLTDPDTAYLDLETTGLIDPFALEVGVLGGDGVAPMDQLVDPHAPIEADASRVHGLTTTDLKGHPGFEAIAAELFGLLANKTVVVFNLP